MCSQSLVNCPRMRFLRQERLGLIPAGSWSSKAILTTESRRPHNQNGKRYVLAAEPAVQFVLSDNHIQMSCYSLEKMITEAKTCRGQGREKKDELENS